MATTATLNPVRGWTRASANGFARAHRHTRVVRFLRWSLPMGGAGLVAIYIAVVLQTIGWVKDLPKVEISQVIPANLTMHNPRYEGFNKDGGSYVVTAKTAVQDLTDLSRITLTGIVADLTDANKTKTKLTATHGFYNNKAEELDLYDGIHVVSENGMHARLTRAKVFTKENVVVSKEPVVVDMPTGTVRSKEMKLHNKTRALAFLNGVEAHLVPKQGAEAKKGKAPADGPPLISAANGPIDITSSRLDVNDTKKTATFSGNVHAVQGDATLETDALEVHYESKAAGDAAATDTAAAGNKISRIASRSPVVLTRGPQDRVTGKSLEFDTLKEVAVLKGDVVMTSGPERRAMANVATIDQRANTVLLTGNVLAIQGRNELSGGRLLVERATGRTRLTTPAASGAKSPGRIRTRFYRSEDKPKKGAEQKASSLPNGTAASAALFRTDPSAPIDVEADQLDVDDRSKTAVFKGSVRAVQGDFVVRTAELVAHYNGQAGLAQQMNNAAKSKNPAQLTRIEARGKVIVTSKNGQNATGDWANFDVKSNKVTLGGDVVLTQGKNVVHGTLLVIDMTTGQSRINEDPGNAWRAKAAPEGEDTGSGIVVQGPTIGGRPSAVFYPKKRKAKSKTGKAPPAQSPATSTSGGAWEPQNSSP